MAAQTEVASERRPLTEKGKETLKRKNAERSRRSKEEKKRAEKVFGLLDSLYPHAKTALKHESPYELLVATILSAQCTDERVNKVTPELFAVAPTPGALYELETERLEEIIRSTGFYKNKAKNLKRAAEVIVNKHGGNIPRTMEELIELDGVARKTANVVLGSAFEVAVGVVVDTHVRRLSQRLGFTVEKDPVKIERDLMDLFPRDQWIQLSHGLILHGRKVCKARRPLCGECVLFSYCPAAED